MMQSELLCTRIESTVALYLVVGSTQGRSLVILDPGRTAVLLVGFQNDYFSPTGILRGAVEDGKGVDRVLKSTMAFLDAIRTLPICIISTPILFTDNYQELQDPIGILKVVRDSGAFQQGKDGSKTISELASMGDRIITVPGKRGLNAFSNTQLEALLRTTGINTIILAGVITSVCIDSTARSAQERGFQVVVLADCTAGRTAFEQNFYCNDIFPIYANVKTSQEALVSLGALAGGA